MGDNVGDCAGMAADVFETYAVSLIGAVLVGALTREGSTRAVVYPFLIGGISILGAIIGILYVNFTNAKARHGAHGRASASAASFRPCCFWPVTNVAFRRRHRTIAGVDDSSARSLYHLRRSSAC